MEPTTFTLRHSAFSSANAILIVDCLGRQGLQTGRTRLQGLHDLLLELEPERFEYAKNFAWHFEADSAEELAGRFDEIKGACELGIRPILFIDGHGHPTKGLEMPSGEFVAWGHLLQYFQSIIQQSAGELTAIVAACHSMAAVKDLRPTERLPFAFYYGYPSEVPAGVVADETQIIYRSLLLDRGQSAMNTKGLKLKSYSEYDHAIPTVAMALLIARAPNTVAEKLPELTRSKLRKVFETSAIEKGIRLAGARKHLNRELRSGFLAIKLARQLMHDTPRLSGVIEDIHAYMQESAMPLIRN